MKAPPIQAANTNVSLSDLVINWHVTEACNYRCGYCYAQWERPDNHEVIRDEGSTRKLLASLRDAFIYGRDQAVPNKAKVRLNFAGGEPLLFKQQVLAAMEHAIELGFNVSLITNGSRLTRPLVEKMAPLLHVLGISVDASTHLDNLKIGRSDTRDRSTPVNELPALFVLAKQINPDLVLKVNTVVNSLNWQADLAPLIEGLAPEQWKVLRMLPSTTRDMEITEAQLEHFLNAHRSLRKIMRVEDNNAMVESYVMVDPHGRFFQNRSNATGYSYSPPIIESGAAGAFETVRWFPEKFLARYDSRARLDSPVAPDATQEQTVESRKK